MAAAKDLTGQRFGKLLVLGLDPEPYISPSGTPTRRWRCRCDCGKEIVVLRSALTPKNGTRSCGCSRQKPYPDKDLTGQRFGKLVVLELGPEPYVSPSGHRAHRWRCQCECGNETVVTGHNLLDGSVRSCGCLLAETAKQKIRGNVLGQYDGTVVSAIRPERCLNSNNSSGVKGVYYSNREQKWIAKIGLRGKTITIGRFASRDAAAAARAEAEQKYFAPVIEEYDAEKHQK